MQLSVNFATMLQDIAYVSLYHQYLVCFVSITKKQNIFCKIRSIFTEIGLSTLCPLFNPSKLRLHVLFINVIFNNYMITSGRIGVGV